MNKPDLLNLTVSAYMFLAFTVFAFLMSAFELNALDSAKITSWIFGTIWLAFAIRGYRGSWRK